MIRAQLICDTHMTWSVEQVCTSKISMYTQQNRSWLVCWGLHSVHRRALFMHLIFRSPQDPCRLGGIGRSREEEEGRGKLLCPAELLTVLLVSAGEGGDDSGTQTLCTGLWGWGRALTLPSVTPFLGKSKANPSLSAVPSSSSSQAPWWHQPCFCNYLTSVVQISNEPARVTNTHISPEKLSTHQTGGWPSGVNSAFRSLFGLYLGGNCTILNTRCPWEAPGKPLCAVAVSVLLPEGCRCSRYLLFVISVCYFALLPPSSGSCSHSLYKSGKSSFS